MASKNTNLHSAKKAKNDEFYTTFDDIENELGYYVNFFQGKIVYCNCDDARESNFFKFFIKRFSEFGLKKLITTGYKENGKGVVLVCEGDKNGNKIIDNNEIVVTELEGNGDFRSEECIEFLKEADVVVTNPPFSLFREYVAQLMEYGKKFLILANNNAITYKEFFPYIKNGNVWLGRTLFTGKMPFFKVPNDYPLDNSRFERREDGLYKQVNAICWFTNIPNDRDKKALIADSRYSNEYYPAYDNYRAIECGRMDSFPKDYNGAIGIPITGLKYLYSDGYLHIEIDGVDTQFEILGLMSGAQGYPLINGNDGRAKFYINNKGVYARILIRKR